MIQAVEKALSFFESGKRKAHQDRAELYRNRTEVLEWLRRNEVGLKEIHRLCRESRLMFERALDK